MSGMLAAAVMALVAVDPPASPPPPVVRIKPRVRVSVAATLRGSGGSYAALGLRASILPSGAPGWMERAARRIRERFSRLWGLKATIRDSILGGS